LKIDSDASIGFIVFHEHYIDDSESGRFN